MQGDERDIIIMSVCYAPDHRGKMSMHFGPINKKGGEKRLNVIFSRARQHMAIISSIRHHQITNVYNAGANYLRRFLQYAENVSTGNMAAARNILDGLATGKSPQRYRTGGTVILKEIREQLEKLGLEVSEQVGQSGFRCSLAVKADAKDKAFSLGIQVDDEDWYRHENVLEQYYQRPAVLESFGWQVLTVYAKDWLQQPQKVMEDILRRLGKPQAGRAAERPYPAGCRARRHYPAVAGRRENGKILGSGRKRLKIIHPAGQDRHQGPDTGEDLHRRGGC